MAGSRSSCGSARHLGHMVALRRKRKQSSASITASRRCSRATPLTIGRCEHVTALISGARALGLSAESDSSHVFLDYCHLFPDWTWDLQFARIARSPNILRVLIAEGVAVLQAALARDLLGEYQAQAAIAALHADAQTAEETEGVQIVEWYDELVRRTDSPVVRLNRAVAVGCPSGPLSGWVQCQPGICLPVSEMPSPSRAVIT